MKRTLLGIAGAIAIVFACISTGPGDPSGCAWAEQRRAAECPRIPPTMSAWEDK